ncbi:alpha/beta hydrolase [Amycolatopsis anabasis]|uniref:alpha/beta hydrolase n=1 Tax=Amycolatopsis anabasis TaxID=1840409 RepID=UPI00131C5B02|nr:alpha/beta hydrolase [Amycolatopsis anabasis]
MVLKAYTAAVMRVMSAAYPDVGGEVTDAGEARRIHARARFPPGQPVAAVRDDVVPGEPDLAVRIYRPVAGEAALPVIVYFHGGGFVLCDLDTHDGVCRLLANEAGALVVAVDYRRAPEHRYPAAVQDAYRAVCWVSARATELGGDPHRLAVAGDSAGGTLATVTTLLARDRGGPPIGFQLLIYPVTDCLAPRDNHAEGYYLTRTHMRWFAEQYLADTAQGEQPYASPLRSPSLAGLPPAAILTAEHDPLREEGEAYGARLAEAGVPVAVHRVNGLFHGVFGLSGILPAARQLEDLAGAALREAFAK